MSNRTSVESAEIVNHYRRKGLRYGELTDALRRHVRLLGPLDPEAADNLEEARPSVRAKGAYEHEQPRMANGWRNWRAAVRADPARNAEYLMKQRAYDRKRRRTRLRIGD